MPRFLLFPRCSFPPAGAVLMLLLWVAIVPTTARAGCSHRVTSRTDWAQLPAFLLELAPDQADDADEGYQPLSLFQALLQPFSTHHPPRPCRGAWCQDGASLPLAPHGSSRIRGESWAARAPALGPPSTPSVCFSRETTRFHPVHSPLDIFHPPRSAPTAA